MSSQPPAPSTEVEEGDDDLIDFVICLDEACVIFDCGWRAPIVGWFDDEGEPTDMREEVCFVAVRLPERGVVPLIYDEDDEEFEPGLLH